MEAEEPILVSSNACFGGFQKVYRHKSSCLKCEMKFAIYFPPQADSEGDNDRPLPAVFWLSGLTCNEQNFITKAGAQRYAAELGLVVVCPDTSPRGVDLPGEDDSYDFGSGAGFYLNAEREPWSRHYRMFEYVVSELPDLIDRTFGDAVDTGRMGISGHSMGGHGALICALKMPGLFKSASAFAPICNPSACPWGIKALEGYLGPRETADWSRWDASSLALAYDGPPLAFLVHQGKKDNFYAEGQLLPEKLVAACAEGPIACILKMVEDYDHSYYFVASFIGEHLEYHAKILKCKN